MDKTSDIYAALSEKGTTLNMTVYRGLKKTQKVITPEEVDDAPQ